MPAAAAARAPAGTKLAGAAALLVEEAPVAVGETKLPLVAVPLLKVPVVAGATALVAAEASEAVAAATAAKAKRKMEGCILHVIMCVDNRKGDKYYFEVEDAFEIGKPEPEELNEIKRMWFVYLEKMEKRIRRFKYQASLFVATGNYTAL